MDIYLHSIPRCLKKHLTDPVLITPEDVWMRECLANSSAYGIPEYGKMLKNYFSEPLVGNGTECSSYNFMVYHPFKKLGPFKECYDRTVRAELAFN